MIRPDNLNIYYTTRICKSFKVTQDYLISNFHYSKFTGTFFRLKDGSEVKPKNIRGYLFIRVLTRGRLYAVHRLAVLYVIGVWPKEQVDHINHIRDDNRWCNLREASRSDNQKNKTLASSNKTGLYGVSYSEKTGKWTVQIKSNGVVEYFGRIPDKFEAICIRKSLEVKHGFHKNHGKTMQLEK